MKNGVYEDFMEQTIVQSNVDEILDPSQEIIEEIVEIVEHVAPAASAKPSYQPTRWPQANALLDKVDDITNGRAGSLVQFATFLVFGGTTTIINLAIVYVAYYRIPMPALTDAWHSLLATVLGCELSLTCNFLLNDNFTFKNMPGRSRSLLARFWRFQTTGIVGTLLNLAIATGLADLAHMNTLVAEAIAVIIVLFYNFFVQSFFTYAKHKQVKIA
jgi:putative flippase GtrA